MEIKVSSRRQEFLNQLDLKTVYDIINYIPKKYVDLNVDRLDITKHNDKVTLLCKISSEVIFKRIKTKLSKMEFEGLIDGEYYTIILFNRDYLKNLLVENRLIKIRNNKKAGPTGIEPATTRLRAKRSARLSYGPG